MGTTASALNEQDIASTAEEFGEDVAELVKNSSSIDPNEDRRWRLVFETYISYAVINGTTYYGSWSKAAKAKTK